MTIREFTNQGFDINCNVKVFDCRNKKWWHEQDEPVFDGFASPFDADDSVLNLQIGYITTDRDGKIIIEGI